MNKRLRKKKHIGEFAEYGFYWEVKLKEHLETDTYINLMERFIEDWHSKRIWLGGGGQSGKTQYSPRMGGYAYLMNERGKPFMTLNKDDVAGVYRYLTAQPEVDICLVGELNDEWWEYNSHGHRVSKWKNFTTNDRYTNEFNLKADLLLGPDGPRCCLGGYIWHEMNGRSGCSKCNKPYITEKA